MSMSPERFTHGSRWIIDPVTTKKVQSGKVDEKKLCDDSKNCWDMIHSRAEAKELQIEWLIGKQSKELWKA